MPVIVIHGDADPAVPYRCGQQVIAQWLGVDNLVLKREHHPGPPPSAASTGSVGSSRSAVVPGGHGYTVLSYADGSGCVVAQLWTVHDMGHTGREVRPILPRRDTPTRGAPAPPRPRGRSSPAGGFPGRCARVPP